MQVFLNIFMEILQNSQYHGNINEDLKEIKRLEETHMPEWVTITEAARRLGIGASKISRVIKNKQIKPTEDPVDKRVKLVDLEEVGKLFKRHSR
jgi:hypothetical protein